ncbi:ATP phosphoribosyltransferase [Enterovirga aerilata]|uniref:ATP phosphoribosyltransferase n=1 Tax=Enterovirga aerilata TaxID=2730920 RepID=A0A849I7W9_9HYPH|nr:ATP phosphoribosyltransferase [Enterovirga sp. DB1703]NNM72160.1 ATP phosphoribosyltransferase [Enterovirga sp. DB1703]
MSDAPLVLAVPSKGRLQENASAFFARAGLPLTRTRGTRDYRGTLAGVPEVEVLFLSAAEVVAQLASGGAHLGVTGEDLLREGVPDADATVQIVTGLGFGHANVVVAVPQAWIDVRTMSDLDEVASDMRSRHGRRLLVATKYLNLTRRFFGEHGIADYRIVESLGATEAAPANGVADLIVDITTTGATLAANGLKVVDDGLILRSEANLMASLAAPWGEGARRSARQLLARIAAEELARTTREIRATLAGGAAMAESIGRQFGATLPDGTENRAETVLRCPSGQVFDVVEALMAAGAANVTVRTLDYVFEPANPLADRLFARLPADAAADHVVSIGRSF